MIVMIPALVNTKTKPRAIDSPKCFETFITFGLLSEYCYEFIIKLSISNKQHQKIKLSQFFLIYFSVKEAVE